VYVSQCLTDTVRCMVTGPERVVQKHSGLAVVGRRLTVEVLQIVSYSSPAYCGSQPQLVLWMSPVSGMMTGSQFRWSAVPVDDHTIRQQSLISLDISALHDATVVPSLLIWADEAAIDWLTSYGMQRIRQQTTSPNYGLEEEENKKILYRQLRSVARELILSAML